MDSTSSSDMKGDKDFKYEVDLPLEVVTHIMKFLSYADRVVASQVCHLWHDATLHPKFLDQEKVVFNKLNLDEIPEVLEVFSKSNRQFYHFLFLDTELTNRVKQFFIKRGSMVRSLVMINCCINEQTFVEILSHCTNLEALELDNCRELFMIGSVLSHQEDVEALKITLKKLKHLSVANNRYLSDALFNRLTSVAPNLENISLAGCFISFHSGIYKKFYPNKLTANNLDFASESVLTLWNVLKHLELKAANIKQINFSKTLIDGKALTEIAQISKLQLEELILSYCEQLSNSGMLAIAQYQTELQVLNLSYCSRITDRTLIVVCKSLNNIRSLCLRNCRAITNLGVVEIRKLTNLQELDLSKCELVSSEGIENGVCYCKRLQKLDLEGLNRITCSTIKVLAESLPKIIKLNLSYCFRAVTNESIQSIFEHQTELRSLKLVNCHYLTDAGLTGLGTATNSEDNKPVETSSLFVNIDQDEPKLHISLRSRAEEEIVRDAYRKKAVEQMCVQQSESGICHGYSVARLRGLQDLDLGCCRGITDVSLKYAFKFRELQHLNLSYCQMISIDGLKHLGRNNPSIDTLNLNNCYNVNDDGIIEVTKSLHRLKYLDLQACVQLTNKSLKAIAQNCRSLRYLDIRLCTNMIPDRVPEIFELTSLHTFYCSSSDSVATVPAHQIPPAPPFKH